MAEVRRNAHLREVQQSCCVSRSEKIVGYDRAYPIRIDSEIATRRAWVRTSESVCSNNMAPFADVLGNRDQNASSGALIEPRERESPLKHRCTRNLELAPGKRVVRRAHWDETSVSDMRFLYRDVQPCRQTMMSLDLCSNGPARPGFRPPVFGCHMCPFLPSSKDN